VAPSEEPFHPELLTLHDEIRTVAVSLGEPPLRIRLMAMADEVLELARSEAHQQPVLMRLGSSQ
jgi:hypothetical protein